MQFSLHTKHFCSSTGIDAPVFHIFQFVFVENDSCDQSMTSADVCEISIASL